MKYGLALPYGNTTGIVKISQLAEKEGWDGLFFGDAIWCEDPIVALAAAATSTHRIRLGTMIIPMPLRKPWKVASESIALDHLSRGRLILGMGAGAVWMGWQGFPDEITDVKMRTEMLDESIDIITLLYQRKQFDYNGKHYHLKLTLVDEQHYPPKPIQQPRIPIWIPGIWPRNKSMKRVLKCDGILAEKMSATGKGEEVTPKDINDIKKYVEANRKLTNPFDIVVSGNTADLNRNQVKDKLLPWVGSGATWWIEVLIGKSEEEVITRIQSGPPTVS